jgi:LysM repeat protein
MKKLMMAVAVVAALLVGFADTGRAGCRYQVVQGDCLINIAQDLGVSWVGLAHRNQLQEPYIIHVGQILEVGCEDEAKAKAEEEAKAVADSGEYTVVKGDTLAEIGARYGVSWRVLAELNGLADPDLLLPGQSLMIPGKDEGRPEEGQIKVLTPVKADTEGIFRWKNPGGDPYRGTEAGLPGALDRLEFGPELQEEALELVASARYEWAQIQVGDRFDKMVSGHKTHERVVADWPDKTRLLAARVYNTSRGRLFHVSICGNWCWQAAPQEPEKPREIISQAPVQAEPVETAPVIMAEEDIKPTPPTPEPKEEVKDDGEKTVIAWDSWASTGLSRDVWDDLDVGNSWQSAMAEIRFGLGRAWGAKHELGGYAQAGQSAGNDQEYEYDWSRLQFGLAEKSIFGWGDISAKLGWFSSLSEGEEGDWQSEQSDRGLALQLSGTYDKRRKIGKAWFPKFVGYANAYLPISSDQEGRWQGELQEEEVYDTTSWRAGTEISLYDFEISGQWRLSPFTMGNLIGEGEASFGEVGGGLILGHGGRDAFKVFGGYRDEFNGLGDSWSVGITVNIADAWNIFR